MKNPFFTCVAALFAGCLLTLLVQCKIKDDFEKNYFDGLARYVRSNRPVYNEDSVIIDALHLTHQILSNQEQIFRGERANLKELYDGSLTADLLTAKGACGSYADVLCQLLQSLGFPARIGQMKVNGRFGGHILTEALTHNGWVVLDASFDQLFVTPSGKLASFKNVAEDWAYYRLQTAPGYRSSYCYADVRYTNWDKIPFLSPALYRLLIKIEGKERVDLISLQPLFLRKFKWYYSLLLAILLLPGATLTLRLFYCIWRSPKLFIEFRSSRLLHDPAIS